MGVNAMSRSHKEMAHVLGLDKNPYWASTLISNTSWSVESAVESTQTRYQKFHPQHSGHLNFEELPIAQFSSTSAKKLWKLEAGGYAGYATWWYSGGLSGHAYTLHAVRDRDKTHFIYVNRGEENYDAEGKITQKENQETVLVFTVPNDQAESFATEMISAVNSFMSRSAISEFLHKHSKEKNSTLTLNLAKSTQKVANCTLANSNMSWHLQLASDLMKKSIAEGKPISFANAYLRTQNIYREMRLQDRVEACKYLIQDRKNYLSERAYLFNFLNVLTKFVVKDYKNQTDHFQPLIAVLAANPENLLSLIEPFIREDSEAVIEEFIKASLENSEPGDSANEFADTLRTNITEVKRVVLENAFKLLPKDQQQKLVSKDNSLQPFASPDLKTREPNKHAFFTSRTPQEQSSVPKVDNTKKPS